MPHKKSEIRFGFMGVITHFMDLCPSNFIRVSRAKPGPRALFGRLWCLYSPTWESVNSHNFGGSVLYALPQNGGNGLKDRFLILGNGPAVEKLEGLTFVWVSCEDGWRFFWGSCIKSKKFSSVDWYEYITNLPIILPRRPSCRINCCPWLSSAWCYPSQVCCRFTCPLVATFSSPVVYYLVENWDILVQFWICNSLLYYFKRSYVFALSFRYDHYVMSLTV